MDSISRASFGIEDGALEVIGRGSSSETVGSWPVVGASLGASC